MAWRSIIGQRRVIDLLVSSLKHGRVAHAYLFSGQEGSGKDAAAIEMAKVLNCEQKSFEACDTCPSCRRMQTLQHPNLHLILALPVGKGEKSGDAPLDKLSNDEIAAVQEQIRLKAENPYHDIVVPKANTIKVNSIREIRRTSSLTSYGGGKNVYVIMDAEQLNDEASNALLKTLEEPHEHTLLILTTAQADLLLPTIVSRCRHLRFDALRAEEIQQGLEGRGGVERKRAALIAHLAGGSYSRALELVNTPLLEQREKAVDLLRAALHPSRKNLVESVDALLAGSERGDVEQLLYLLQSWLGDAMTLSEGVEHIVNVDDAEALGKFVSHYRQIDYPSVFRALRRAISLLNKNVYIPLILINLGIDLRNLIVPNPRHSKQHADIGS